MASPFGTQRTVVGAHYGLRDWLMQRLTAVVLTVFTVVVLVQALMAQPLDYAAWSGIFVPQWMRMLTFVSFVSVAWHAWVGMRDVLMDYVKPVGIRLALHLATLIWLVGCLGWSVQVLWRL